MTATGNVYRWNPDSRAWSSELTQTGVVARIQTFGALPPATRSQLEQLIGFPTDMLADKPPPKIAARRPDPDSPPQASSSVRSTATKRAAANAVSDGDSSTDEESNGRASTGKRPMRNRGVVTSPGTSADAVQTATTSPPAVLRKRTSSTGTSAITRRNSRQRITSRASSSLSPHTPQLPAGSTPSSSHQSTPIQPRTLNLGENATTPTHTAAQPPPHSVGTTMWVCRGTDNGWAVVTDVASASATHRLWYSMCSNVEMHTSSTPRQHPNTSCRGCFTIWGSELITNITTPPPLLQKPRLSKKQRRKAITKQNKAKKQASASAYFN